MQSDVLAELTRLQEQEERAVREMEEQRRQLATLQALLADAKRRGEAAGAIERQAQAAAAAVTRADREVAALRERIAAAEQALPANLRDDDAEP